MKFFRKYLFSFAAVAFLALVSVLVIEGAHHHDNLESHDDCSICSWQATGSSAPSTPIPPLLFHALLFVALFTFTSFFTSTTKSFSALGRAPPSILL